MTRAELVELLLIERFAPVDREYIQPAPIVLSYALDENDDRPDAQVIRLDDRRAAA